MLSTHLVFVLESWARYFLEYVRSMFVSLRLTGMQNHLRDWSKQAPMSTIDSARFRWSTYNTSLGSASWRISYIQPALEHIKNTYCMGKRPFPYLYMSCHRRPLEIFHICITALNSDYAAFITSVYQQQQ